MDQSADLIHIDCDTAEQTLFCNLILWVATAKGKDVTISELNTDISPTVHHRGCPVHGVWPILEYLDHRLPEPELMPDTPERRAVVRSTTERILRQHIDWSMLEQYYMPDGTLAPIRRPNLMDLAVAASALLPESPYWTHQVAQELARILRQKRVTEREGISHND